MPKFLILTIKTLCQPPETHPSSYGVPFFLQFSLCTYPPPFLMQYYLYIKIFEERKQKTVKSEQTRVSKILIKSLNYKFKDLLRLNPSIRLQCFPCKKLRIALNE